jgi:hypothetical protein
MREPDTFKGNKPGVEFSVTTDPESATVTGESRTILLNQFLNQTPEGSIGRSIDLMRPFAVTFNGYFRAPQDGVYEFQVESTWDTTVVLGGNRTIIDDTGTAASKKRSVVVPLKAGLHKISIRYNHRGGDSNFRFRWGIKGQGLRQAYGAEFVH